MARRARGTTALVVLAIGALVSLTAGGAAAFPEFVSFLVVALCAAALAVSSNRDLAASPGPTGREIGTGVLILLLFAVAVLGIMVDLVVGLVWRSARRRPPVE